MNVKLQLQTADIRNTKLEEFISDKRFLKGVFFVLKREYGNIICVDRAVKVKENTIYIRVEFRQSLGMNFVSPFQSKGSSKCTNHVNVYKLYAVEYINTVRSPSPKLKTGYRYENQF